MKTCLSLLFLISIIAISGCHGSEVAAPANSTATMRSEGLSKSQAHSFTPIPEPNSGLSEGLDASNAKIVELPGTGKVGHSISSLSATIDVGRLIQPQPDVKTTGIYKTALDARIEIEGVCNISESGIDCWTRDGIRSLELTKRIQASVERQHAQGFPQKAMSIRSGMKNRLVVFKSSQKPMWRTTFNVLWVGDQKNQTSYVNISLDGSSSQSILEPKVTYQLKAMAAKGNPLTTKAMVNVREWIESELSIRPRLGEQALLAGEIYSIVSILKRNSEMQNSGVVDATWVVTMKTSGKVRHPVLINLKPFDANGKVIDSVDDEGNPLATTVAGKRWVKPTAFSIMIKHNMIQIYLKINPEKVARFGFYGETNNIVQINGIPLDPKRY